MSWFEGVLVLGFLALLAATLKSAEVLAGHYGMGSETKRKIVHVSLGCAALLLPFVFGSTLPVLLLCALALLFLLAVRRSRLGAALHDVKRNSFGELYFALSIAVLFLLKETSPRVEDAANAVMAIPDVYYLLPIGIMTLADTAAAMAGTEYGKRIFAVENGRKSFEGVVAFFGTAWIASMIFLLLFTEMDRTAVIVLSMMLALVGATIEAESWGGLDNLFVPIGLHLIFVNLSAASTLKITVAASAYGALVLTSYYLARAHDVRRQPLRAAVLLLTVTWLSFGLDDAILIFVAIGMTILANRAQPPKEEHADLHTIFALFVIGIFWLVVGNAWGRDMILFFNLAVAVYAAAMAVIGIRRQPLLLAVAGSTVVGVMLFRLLYFPNEGVNLTIYSTVLVVGIIGTILVSRSHRVLFDRHRAAKATFLALGVSAGALLGVV